MHNKGEYRLPCLYLKKMTKEMHDEVLAMVEQFYHSDAVSHPVPMEKLEQTFADAVSEDSILEGFVLNEDDTDRGLCLYYGILCL